MEEIIKRVQQQNNNLFKNGVLYFLKGIIREEEERTEGKAVVSQYGVIL